MVYHFTLNITSYYSQLCIISAIMFTVVILESITIFFQGIQTTVCPARFVPGHCMIIYCMVNCVADQTPLDLVRSNELRQILAAYQDKVRANK